jgi:hypothetical protein
MNIQVSFSRGSFLLCGGMLLTAALLGSCSSSKLSSADVITQGFAELRSTAESTISDSIRREKYLQGARRLENELRAYDDYAYKAVESYRKVFTDYDAGQEGLMRLSAEFREQQQKARTAFIDAHSAMAASVTADEWKALGKKESRILEDLRDAAAGSLQ